MDDVAAFFAGQLGLVTLDQARSIGITPDGVRHRVRSGSWERVGSGLYRLRGTPGSWEQTLLVAVLRAGPPCWVSHFTALALWGYDAFTAHGLELTVPLHRRPRLPNARVHRSGTVDEADLRVVGVVPVLCAARTLVDVSSRFDDAALGALIDDGLRRRVMSLSALHAVARRLPTIAPGRSPRRMQRLLEPRIAGFHPGDSVLESTVFEVLVRAGFPPPARQHRIVANGHTYFVDLAYPDVKLAIEIDGFAFHRGRDVFDHDRRRQNDLVLAGWQVLRFTSRSSERDILDAVRPFVFGR